MEMTKREELLTRMIRIYGFEHEVVIEFARMCESDNFTDGDLEVIVETHEANPVGFDEDEDFQKKGVDKRSPQWYNKCIK